MFNLRPYIYNDGFFTSYERQAGVSQFVVIQLFNPRLFSPSQLV